MRAASAPVQRSDKLPNEHPDRVPANAIAKTIFQPLQKRHQRYGAGAATGPPTQTVLPPQEPDGEGLGYETPTPTPPAPELAPAHPPTASNAKTMNRPNAGLVYLIVRCSCI